MTLHYYSLVEDPDKPSSIRIDHVTSDGFKTGFFMPKDKIKEMVIGLVSDQWPTGWSISGIKRHLGWRYGGDDLSREAEGELIHFLFKSAFLDQYPAGTVIRQAGE